MAHTTSKAPVEAKVKTSTLAAALTALVLGFISTKLFSGAEVPDFLGTFVGSAVAAGVTGAVTFVAGWTAKHTPRWVTVAEDAGDAKPLHPLD